MFARLSTTLAIERKPSGQCFKECEEKFRIPSKRMDLLSTLSSIPNNLVCSRSLSIRYLWKMPERKWGAVWALDRLPTMPIWRCSEGTKKQYHQQIHEVRMSLPYPDLRHHCTLCPSNWDTLYGECKSRPTVWSRNPFQSWRVVFRFSPRLRLILCIDYEWLVSLGPLADGGTFLIHKCIPRVDWLKSDPSTARLRLLW